MSSDYLAKYLNKENWWLLAACNFTAVMKVEQL